MKDKVYKKIMQQRIKSIFHKNLPSQLIKFNQLTSLQKVRVEISTIIISQAQ